MRRRRFKAPSPKFDKEAIRREYRADERKSQRQEIREAGRKARATCRERAQALLEEADRAYRKAEKQLREARNVRKGGLRQGCVLEGAEARAGVKERFDLARKNLRDRNAGSAGEKKREETDEEVVWNLEAEDPALVPIFRGMRRYFRGKPDMSRTEQVLEWASKHPEDEGELERSAPQFHSDRRSNARGEEPSQAKPHLQRPARHDGARQAEDGGIRDPRGGREPQLRVPDRSAGAGCQGRALASPGREIGIWPRPRVRGTLPANEGVSAPTRHNPLNEMAARRSGRAGLGRVRGLAERVPPCRPGVHLGDQGSGIPAGSCDCGSPVERRADARGVMTGRLRGRSGVTQDGRRLVTLGS